MDQLQFVEASSAGLVVACDDNLFLLHGQWQAAQRGVLMFKDAGVEAVLCGSKRALLDCASVGRTWYTYVVLGGIRDKS